MINCLAHARREFIDVEAYFPQECAMVIKSLASVYKYDKETKEQKLSDEDRLLYHQKYSKPIMDELKIKIIINDKTGVITTDNIKLLKKPSSVFLPRNATIKQKKK